MGLGGTMSIPAASPTTSSPCSTCSALRLLLVRATFRIVGWRASADPGGGRELAPLMGKPINEEVVLEHWNDALRLTASIKTVSVKPSAMLRKLGAYRQQNHLYLALGLGTAPTRSSGESTQTVAVSGLERPGVRRRTSSRIQNRCVRRIRTPRVPHLALVVGLNELRL